MTYILCMRDVKGGGGVFFTMTLSIQSSFGDVVSRPDHTGRIFAQHTSVRLSHWY